ncbi:RNA-directed DNA polymerase, eukaryota, partial [Tanacetum coccineum]
RKLIDEFTLSEVSSSTRWIKAVPIKVNVLAWKIKLDNLPTRLNISRRGMDIDSILCPTCGKAVESTRHIFFTCQIARDILHLITSWWNIPYMEVSSYEEWDEEEEETEVAKESKDMALSIMKEKILAMVELEKAIVKDYTKLVVTDWMVDYVLEKYGNNWKCEDEISSVILEDLWLKYGKGDNGKGKEAKHDHLKVNKDDKGKGKVHDIQTRVKKLKVDLVRAIKAKQVDDHDDDLD